MRVRLTGAPDGAIALESSYRDWEPVLPQFKLDIPYDGRHWDAARKRWIVSALYAADLLTFLQQVGAQILDDRPTVPGRALPAMPDLSPRRARDCPRKENVMAETTMLKAHTTTEAVARLEEIAAFALELCDLGSPLRPQDVNELGGAVRVMAQLLVILVQECAAQKHALMHVEARLADIEEGLGGVASDVRHLQKGGRDD